MKCPVCNQEMKKVRWEVTSNLKSGQLLKEYEKTTYKCLDDDVWVNTEIPVAIKPTKQTSK